MWGLKIESPDERHEVKACATRANVEKSWEDWDEVVEVFYNTHSRGCTGGLGLRRSSSSAGVTITITPTVASVITNRTQLFSGAVTGSSNTAITWTTTCATGVAANTCGSIDATGLYTGPGHDPNDDLQRHDDDCPDGYDHGHRASRYDQNCDGHPDHRHRNQHHHYANDRYRGH